ncbi:Transcription initiation protein spt3 [Vanrija albida]|uniref:Transcription initiation protein spt3 n=1 Tax=Vanrija albida TaxID=181172 RepID=A0ABR3Q2M4_9TREE
MAALALPTGPKPPVALALPIPQNASPASNSPAPSAAAPALAQARKPSSMAVPQSNSRPADSGRASASPSPEPEDDADAEGDDDDEEALGSSSKKSKGSKKKKGAAAVGLGGLDAAGKPDYKYTNEISQMMFVFGEVQDPLPETVRLVEDIVRGQIIEIVTRARLLTHLRSSRFLSAEDLIFLIRDDRGKVNRLRTYLSWKDVRKRAKDDEEGGDVDVDDADKNAVKGRKPIVKLSWELLTPFSDFLRALPTQQNRAEDDEDEDEDELQAHQDSMQRLRDADEVTKKMTKDEYVHYSDCRQASFTYRKARRFRDFINFSAYLDVRPNDDIIDILGFLAFEMVSAFIQRCSQCLASEAQECRK